MDRLNTILEQAKKQKQAASTIAKDVSEKAQSTQAAKAINE